MFVFSVIFNSKLDYAILMTCHYPDLSSVADWLNKIPHAAGPIRSTTQIWVVTRHQYGISALVLRTSFGGETSGSVTKCRLFSHAKFLLVCEYSCLSLLLTARYVLSCETSLAARSVGRRLYSQARKFAPVRKSISWSWRFECCPLVNLNYFFHVQGHPVVWY